MQWYLSTFLALTMLAPRHFGTLSVPIVAGVVLALAGAAARIRIPARFALAAGVLVATGTLVVCFNYVRFGLLEAATYWIAGPVLWFGFALAIATQRRPHVLVHRAIVLAGALAALGNLAFLAYFLSGNRATLSFPGFDGYSGTDSRGFFAYSTSVLAQIGYILPYLAYRWAVDRDGTPRFERLLTLALAIAGILSLRVSIILTSVLSGLLWIVIRTRGRYQRPAIVLASALLLVGAWVPAENLFRGDVAQGIYQLKLQDKVSGSDPRFNQIVFWVDRFLDSPLLGNGISSTSYTLYDLGTGDLVARYVGSIDNPYGNEVFLFRLLSEIGLLLLPIAGAYLAMSMSRRATSPYLWQVRAVRLALASMLLQTQTNTYLYTSGWMFVFFIPLVFALPCSAEADVGVRDPAPTPRPLAGGSVGR